MAKVQDIINANTDGVIEATELLRTLKDAVGEGVYAWQKSKRTITETIENDTSFRLFYDREITSNTAYEFDVIYADSYNLRQDGMYELINPVTITALFVGSSLHPEYVGLKGSSVLTGKYMIKTSEDAGLYTVGRELIVVNKGFSEVFSYNDNRYFAVDCTVSVATILDEEVSFVTSSISDIYPDGEIDEVDGYYYKKILPNPSRIDFGTVTLSAETQVLTISHNLNNIPNLIAVYPQKSTENLNTKIISASTIFMENGEQVACFSGGNSTAALSGISVDILGAMKDIANETTINLDVSSTTTYNWSARTYEWIAVKFS